MPRNTTSNVRMKHRYLDYLKQARGRDEKTLDKIAAALSEFEQAIGHKDFKQFNRGWGERFKMHLSKARNRRTGKPLSPATVDAALAHVKGFVLWLADQSGFKSRVTYSDAEYFNNSRKGSRVAHAARPVPYPSMEQAFHAFQAMPQGNKFERRDKALFAFFMLTGARVGAVSTLLLKHVNLFDGHIYQDPRDVATKNAKPIDTWLLPVDPTYRECFEQWVTYLREVELFGDTDAVFPKIEIGCVDGSFVRVGFAREGYANGGKLNAIIRVAFARVQLREFTPHAFRKTLARYGDSICRSREQFKAWSLNLGHEHMATTIDSYIPVSRERQGELIKALGQAPYGAGAQSVPTS
ncbi:integrase [Maritimibacter sp. 55A14]|uniref:site-specific integrase n=1 Tax=Maritimibacter sp. 55A14 TaxID=2174844 RepID=UPI000D6106EE|nr:tyrosine-type recombinase/integrase [Maritimibacter sp. 55A14]PWE31367.1 integrase [Maritimibacter sp. 55A14]